MERKLDLRIVKTYSALIKAFKELLAEKRFEEITVNELCDRAVIRRATFYKHFADKYEFLVFMVKEMQKSKVELRELIDPKQPKEFYVSMMRNLLNEIEENEALISSLSESSILPLLMDALAEQTLIGVKAVFKEEFGGDAEEFHIELDLAARILTASVVQCTKWWLTNRERMSKEDMIRQLSQLLFELMEFHKNKLYKVKVHRSLQKSETLPYKE